ncbi:MAG: hypothetical protein AAF761_11190, partial [Pseudomonadota bacterium]
NHFQLSNLAQANPFFWFLGYKFPEPVCEKQARGGPRFRSPGIGKAQHGNTMTAIILMAFGAGIIAGFALLALVLAFYG